MSYSKISSISNLQFRFHFPIMNIGITGYPQGLKGEEIPLPARIFTVIDIWDALLSDRPYRSAWSQEKVLEYIQMQRGKIFDPEVANVFLTMVTDEQLT